MILSFKKFNKLLFYLSLKVGVHFMNSQHLRLKWHLEKLDKYGPRIHIQTGHLRALQAYTPEKGIPLRCADFFIDAFQVQTIEI